MSIFTPAELAVGAVGQFKVTLEHIQKFVRVRCDEVDEIDRARVKNMILSGRLVIPAKIQRPLIPLKKKAKSQYLWAILYKN